MIENKCMAVSDGRGRFCAHPKVLVPVKYPVMVGRVFSFFKAPISNVNATCEISEAQLCHYIGSNAALAEATQRVRAMDEREYRRQKTLLLPCITPAGIFSRRKAEYLQAPSGLFVVDIDHLPSAHDARTLRDELFADPWLKAHVAFVSPSGKGVKLLVPYQLSYDQTVQQSFVTSMAAAWDYIEGTYGVEVDRANKDIARACLLAADPEVRLKTNEEYSA